ncbi:DUF4129 domain-containing protein [Halopelagius longus]|uniref:DUF4129 domain-containing protein n=1 Tax=Halopelagius longus TaxID=1236180 RepID=A0A1H1DGW1_9EURY|nr:DUF4129 domain-containing protein [Halopelagius longus]RDI71331.1 DUF4129 domain-containing protein [Halopelagius longus]SDQ75771.1 protein of unknown function [Halopelagius longus]
MKRSAGRTLALALLALVALGVAAATIDTAVTGGAGGGVGPSGATGAGPTTVDDVGPAEEGGSGGGLFGPVCIPFLTRPLVMVGLLVLFAGVVAATYRKTRSVLPPLAVFVSFGVPGYVLWAFLTVCSVEGSTSAGVVPGAGLPNVSAPIGGGGASGSGGGALTAPSAVFGLVLALALVGAVALLVLSTGDDEASDAAVDEDAEEPDVDVGDIGRAAGAAADRIERDADVENEVYRAWGEMTDLLDISNPKASTPGEFADAAVAAGMARDDVTELTRLFEDVRYGGEAPTEEREARAIEALRRIESTYAGAGEET